jgi:hypothetical protein
LSQTGIVGETGTGAGAFQDYTFGDMLLNHDSNYVQDARQSGKLIGQESIGGVLCDKVKLSPASGPVLLLKAGVLLPASNKMSRTTG